MEMIELRSAAERSRSATYPPRTVPFARRRALRDDCWQRWWPTDIVSSRSAMRPEESSPWRAWPSTSTSTIGRHLYLYDLVVTEGARSKGYGGLLMDHVEDIARREGCETAALAVRAWNREGARRLYERRGYLKPSYAMRKALR